MADISRFNMALVTPSREHAISIIIGTNQLSQKHGMVLTEKDARQIINARDNALKTTGRIEVDLRVINEIIRTFCQSPYINQANYADMICQLVEAFYHMKNETREQIGDDDLIYTMRDYFDNRCFGSIELLTGRELEKLVDEIRFGRHYSLPDEREEV